MSVMILGFPIFSILAHFLSIKTFWNSAWTQNNKDFIVETMYNKQLQHQYHTEVVASDNNHLNYIFISSSHTNIQVFLLSSQFEKNKILNFFFQQLLFYATARIFHYSSWIALRWNWENIQENVRNTGGGRDLHEYHGYPWKSTVLKKDKLITFGESQSLLASIYCKI